MKILENSGQDFEVIDYMKTPPSPEQLKILSKQMGILPRDFIRNKESLFKDLGLKPHLNNNGLLFKNMSENPRLIERPIVVKGNKAVLGRPPEKVQDLLDS